jgi:polyphosphate:AMP phosphotransferase
VFDASELGHKLKKKEYQELVPPLRAELVTLQYRLRESGFSVVVALEGDDQIGVRQSLNVANQWLDPRFLGIESYGLTSGLQAEDEYPHYWRYWRQMPPRGRIAIMSNAWTLRAVREQVLRDSRDDALLERRIRHILGFEEELVADGTLVLKLWLHVSKSEAKKRVKLADEDPVTGWQINDLDRRVLKNYDAVREISEYVLRQTSTGEAPWTVIESTDDRFRDVRIATLLRDALRARLEQADAPPSVPVESDPAAAPSSEQAAPTKTVLDTVDLSASLSDEKYDKQLARWQAELSRLSREAFDHGVSSVLALQGWDAAGKGGAVRRVTAAIDASICRVVPIATPSEEEKSHHYLWRFWRRLPRKGRVRIFDRSWYERVLVERVEGFASEAEWRRAYHEIRDFEEQLCEHGVVVLKFWLHIDPDEQLRRFQDREKTPFKQFKITEDDYRNRERRADYEVAVNEMVARTDHPHARWHLIAANDKRHARVEVLKIFCKALEKALAGV